MIAFAPRLSLLETVPDPRRAEGKVYRLPHVLLFSILAIVSGGNSYRSVATFIDVHRRRLNRTRGLALRHDYGSNFMSRDFQDEIALLGIES